MRLLLDTCVLSELRRPQRDPGVVAAIAAQTDEDLFLSVLTVGEVSKGIGLLADGPKRRGLESWLADLRRQFSDRLLGVNAETAEIWGLAWARASKRGVVVPAIDGLLAAQALQHGLAVATRNEDHFRETGALVFNPWSGVGYNQWP